MTEFTARTEGYDFKCGIGDRQWSRYVRAYAGVLGRERVHEVGKHALRDGSGILGCAVGEPGWRTCAGRDHEYEEQKEPVH